MFITVFLVIPSDHTQINWYTKRGVLAALYGSTGRLKITTGALGQVCVCKFGALTKVQRQLRMQLEHFLNLIYAHYNCIVYMENCNFCVMIQ